VTANVGGVYEYNKSSDEESAVYTHVEQAKQKDAIRFLNTNVFSTPQWLIDKEILSRIEETGITERIRGLQDRTLAQLMNPDRLNRMIENNAVNGQNAYTINEMFDDLIESIFSEAKSKQAVSLYRRNLQRTFIEGLERTLQMESNRYEHTDMKAIARAKLKSLSRMLKTAGGSDDMSRFHFDDLVDRINDIFEAK